MLLFFYNIFPKSDISHPYMDYTHSFHLALSLSQFLPPILLVPGFVWWNHSTSTKRRPKFSRNHDITLWKFPTWSFVVVFTARWLSPFLLPHIYILPLFAGGYHSTRTKRRSKFSHNYFTLWMFLTWSFVSFIRSISSILFHFFYFWYTLVLITLCFMHDSTPYSEIALWNCMF